MKKSEIIMIGYSGHAFVAIDILQQMGHVVKGYCDKEEKRLNPYFLSYLGNEEDLFKKSIDDSGITFFIGIGNNSIREKVHNFVTFNGGILAFAIHPSSVISSTSKLGKGVMVAANATINPVCEIGNGVICNTSCTIEHECVIGDFAHICPGTVLCGNVIIGKNSFVGANSVIKQGVRICDNVTIGAGSTVIKDITTPGTYYGNLLKPHLKLSLK